MAKTDYGEDRQPTKEEQKQRVVRWTSGGGKGDLLNDLINGKGPKAPTYNPEEKK